MKNQKTKYYLKYNLIGLLIGGIIFGSLGVYAALIFPSNEVSFDPSNSTLTSTNVQSAIDELYKKCTNPSAGNPIIEDAGLEKDEYECRYFFTGANPNNYITFNNETAGWRIISVECDGRIKIMRDASIGNRAWDTSDSNNWARPATLNTYLNGTYYNGLNNTARSQIVASNFSIGAVEWKVTNMSTQVSAENSNKWYGKIALPTLSEYIRTNNNKSSCGTFSLIYDNYSRCVSTGWMDTTSVDWWWTLSPYSDYSYGVFIVSSGGAVYDSRAYVTYYAVRPVVYLSSEVQITGGTGTQSDPYQILSTGQF